MSTGNQLPVALTARYANEPYVLLLEETPWKLTGEILEKNVVPADLKHKRFGWPEIKFVSLQKGMLELNITSDKKTFVLAIQVEKDMLQVACNCAEPVQKLCVHAYSTFSKLLICKEEDHFEQYRSGGLVEFALAHKEYFIIKEDDAGLTVNPKPVFGKIFSSAGGNLPQLSNLLSKGIPPAALYNRQQATGLVNGYMVIYSGRRYHLPLVLPFTGKLNKTGSGVKSFTGFLTTGTGLAGLDLTPGQAILHRQCIRMFKLAEQLPYKLFTDPNDLPGYIEWFQLLQQTWPLLLQQPFVYSYYSYRIQYLKKRIWKRFVKPCKLHTETASLSFELTLKTTHCTLKPIVTTNGRVLKATDHERYAVLIKHGENGSHYLLNSLTDMAVLEYFDNPTQTLTVFGPHYKEFSSGLSTTLCERYPLHCIFSGKKRLQHKTIQLKPLKKIFRVQTHTTGLLLFPFVEYDNGIRANALQHGTVYLSENENHYVIMKRDKSYEAGFVQQLLALNETFNNQLNEDCFYLFIDKEKTGTWLKETTVVLTGCEIEHKQNQ